MNIANIEEVLLGPTEQHLVTKLVGAEKEELINGYKWHYLVSISGINKLIIHQATNNFRAFHGKKSSFVEELQKMNRPKFRDLLFLTTLYPILMPLGHTATRMIKIEGHLPEKISALIKAGCGYLFYYHQLEILYSGLTNCSHAEAVLFRKDWNLKKEYTRDVARSIKINSHIDLFGLIKQYSTNENLFFYQANYHGAYHLFEHINSSLKSS
ncbi:MAG: hypothetical protein RLZ10_1172 [Bacteroidota bacterium]|jgi:hypothetical protein